MSNGVSDDSAEAVLELRNVARHYREGAARLDVAVCVGRLRQVEHAVDHHVEVPTRDPGEQRVDHGVRALRVAGQMTEAVFRPAEWKTSYSVGALTTWSLS